MRVFISSAMSEDIMKRIRRRLADAIKELGHEPILLEDYYPDRPGLEPPPDVVEEMVDKADVYIGIFYKRWGSPYPRNNPPDDIDNYIKGWDRNKPLSYTAYEYYLARKRGIPTIIFVLEDENKQNEQRDKDLEYFLEKIKPDILYHHYKTEDDLIAKAKELIPSKKLIDFLEKQSEYFTGQNDQASSFQDKPLKDCYVLNDLIKVGMDTWTKDDDEVSGDKWSIEDFLNGQDRFVIIAADFGTGKSSFCYYIAYELATEYLNFSLRYQGDRRLRYQLYIPVLVELKRGPDKAYNNEFLDHVLKNVVELGKPGRKALVIFDGLDKYVNLTEVLEKIRRLMLEYGDDIKIILTTRLVKEYYDLFTRSENNPIGPQNSYVRIKPFNKNQFNEFFKKCLGKEKIEGKDPYDYFTGLGLTHKELGKPLFALELVEIYKCIDKIFNIDDENELDQFKNEAIHRILRTLIFHKFNNYNSIIYRGIYRGRFAELLKYFYNLSKNDIYTYLSGTYDREIYGYGKKWIKKLKKKLDTERRCPYCGSGVKPIIIRFNIYAVSFSLKLYHCEVCGRWFEPLNPDLKYLLSNMYVEKNVLEFLRGRYGVTRYREFLERNFVGFTRRFGRDDFVRWIVTSVRKRKISSPFPYDFIIRVGETGEGYYLTCHRRKDKGKVIYYCDDITPV